MRKAEMGAKRLFAAIFNLPSTIVPRVPSSIFQTSFPPASAGKPAGALIVSVGSGLARSRLALAAGGSSYSIRRFGGPEFIKQIVFRPKHLSIALRHRISKSVAVSILVCCLPSPMPTCQRSEASTINSQTINQNPRKPEVRKAMEGYGRLWT